LTAEVEKKLDDLFQEEETLQTQEATELISDSEAVIEGGGAPEEKRPEEESALAPLKSIVLSLEWEITDEGMEDFLAQTEALRPRCEEDQVLKTFIQILQALGKYIKRHKADSHPDAVRLLSTSFQDFERAFGDAGLPEGDRKALLDERIREFMALKQAIAAKRRGMDGKGKGEYADPEAVRKIMHEVMEEFIGQVKSLIREEFERLTHQIKGGDQDESQDIG